MAITVEIAGVSKPPAPRSIRLSLMTGGRGTHSMTVVSTDGTYTPTIGQTVEVLDGATTIWSGSIDYISRQSVPGTLDPQEYRLECVTWEQRLDRRRCKHHSSGNVAIYTRNFEFTVNAGTDVITATGHGRSNADIVRVKSSGTLPAGLAADTDYHVRDVSGATFKLAATAGGAAIDITDTGTGTHVLMTYRAGEAVSDLLTNFADGEGITEADIDLGAVIDKAVFDAESSVWEAIESLATASQYIAYIDVSKGLHFCARTVTSAPFNITNANRAKLRSLVVNLERAEKCNTAMGRVAWAAFTPTVETFNGDGSAVSWDVTDPVADVVSMDVDGTEKTFGQYLIDSGKDFYWEYGTTTIRQDSGGTVLSAGPPAEVLTVKYRALGGDTVVSEDSTNVTNTAAAEGGSGRYERFYDRSSQLGAVQVLAEMDALVAVLKNTGTEVIYEIDTVEWADAPTLRPGMLQSITVGEYDLADDFLIDQIDIADDSDGAYLTYRVRAISGALTNWVDFYKAMAGRSSSATMTGASGGTGGGGTATMPDPPDNFATCTVSVDTTGEKVKLTINLTKTDPPVDGVPTKAHIWLEIPDRSAGTPIILDGTYKLGDGGKLGGRWRGEDKGYFEWDSADPQPIVIEVEHVTESTACRAWAVSGIEGAENELSTSISATFTIDPPAVLKPNSGTAYGPNLTSISAGTVTTDDLSGTDMSYIPFTVVGLPTEANFLGWEAVSGDWPDDTNTYTHTGILTELTTTVETPTPAQVITVTFWAVACYQGADGNINRNPIVRGVTPSCTVTLGTTGGTINASAISSLTVIASQIVSVNASSILGSIAASQIGSVNASAITGSITSSQIGSVNASAITGSITADHIESVNAAAINGAITSTQIGSVAADTITGVVTAGQIDTINATQIEGVIVSSQLQDNILSTLAKYSPTIRPVPSVGSLPALPDSDYPNDSLVILTTDHKVYRNANGSWVSNTSASDITGQIADAQIAGIAANKITGLIIAGQIQSIAASQITGQISSSQIFSLAADKITGLITSGQIGSVAAASITGTITADHIASVNAAAITGSITAGQITSITAGQLTGTIVTNQIGDLQITSAKIASLSADKITAGTIAASVSMTAPTITSTNAGNVASLRDGYVESTSVAYRAKMLGGVLALTSIAAGQPSAQHTSDGSAWLDAYGFTLTSVYGSTGLRVNAAGGVNRASITASAANFTSCPIQVSGVTVVDTDRSLRNVVDVSLTGWIYVDGVAVVKSQQATVLDPVGGLTVDSEARTAIAAIIDRLQAHGLIS